MTPNSKARFQCLLWCVVSVFCCFHALQSCDTVHFYHPFRVLPVVPYMTFVFQTFRLFGLLLPHHQCKVRGELKLTVHHDPCSSCFKPARFGNWYTPKEVEHHVAPPDLWAGMQFVRRIFCT
ncbi:hypothetical protein Zm00014a_037127 [Zea mays]|uniref:Secreted protein n=2 Tax=Zea mays TaxID=4577 RepID=A0A8J8Y1T3_MAIZE|nr:unknown [Zea mays]ONM25014.1 PLASMODESMATA CALLOSE-BINDING PROTEIN 2 [Zea mays]PWZ41360.1 hypothetical protein Zm00014a_037127 [Zea mays]PWZ41361.1 hypothetical protein Zm00014a_037127 [Zea mays]